MVVIKMKVFNCKCTLRNLFTLLIFLFILIILKLFSEFCLLSLRKNSVTDLNPEGLVLVDKPIILWWTPFSGQGNLLTAKMCGDFSCYITQDRRLLANNQTKIIAFYGSNFDPLDIPTERLASSEGPYWALVHEESPKNKPILLHNTTLNLFNFSATFSRYSSFPLTTQYLTTLQELEGGEYVVPLSEKNKLLSEIAPVLYIQSDCSTPLNRDSYVAELMKYVAVDSYGACLNNKKLPKEISDRMETINSKELTEKYLHFIAQYKFILAFENSVCYDYITEKLWRPLIVGSIPIYMGSPTVEDWLPNDKSAILVSKFESPKELGEFIMELNNNDAEYTSYLRHKTKFSSNSFKNIQNQLLVNQMIQRQWGDDSSAGVYFPEAFECFLCEQLYSPKLDTLVDESHYSCPEPVSPLSGKKNESNWWHGQWRFGKCEGLLLRDLISNNKTVTKEEFMEKLTDYLNSKNC